MSLRYVYVDLKTQRIFRNTFFDHRFIPGVLEGVYGMVAPYSEIFESAGLSWSKYKGIHASDSTLDSVDQRRLKVLNDRCEALEFLYRTIYLLRRQLGSFLPYDEVIFNLRLKESLNYLQTQKSEDKNFLQDFANAKDLSLQEAAQMVCFLDSDRKEILRQSEALKLKWEKVFLETEEPVVEVENFKSTVYLG